MRTPLVVVTGVEPRAIDATLLNLSWDVPGTVAVRHHIDPVGQVLTRVVSHAGGVLEREHTTLEHACIGCALREDIVPTLQRLARERRWSAVVLGLPAGMDADQLTHLATRDTQLARHVRLSSLVAALDGEGAVEQLLGDQLLRERGWHTGPDDDRGVGEVLAAQVERSDLVAITGSAVPEAVALARALARPGADVVADAGLVDLADLTARRHEHQAALAWSSPLVEGDLPPLAGDGVWRLDLCSPRPFHPERLLEGIDRLGSGAHRSRGCFWLPTRPDSAVEWSGAGGQLSIGNHGSWGRTLPRTRLVFTGLGTAPTGLADAFEEALLDLHEALPGRSGWDLVEDGLEPWLGDIRDVA